MLSRYYGLLLVINCPPYVVMSIWSLYIQATSPDKEIHYFVFIIAIFLCALLWKGLHLIFKKESADTQNLSGLSKGFQIVGILLLTIGAIALAVTLMFFIQEYLNKSVDSAAAYGLIIAMPSAFLGMTLVEITKRFQPKSTQENTA